MLIEILNCWWLLITGCHFWLAFPRRKIKSRVYNLTIHSPNYHPMPCCRKWRTKGYSDFKNLLTFHPIWCRCWRCGLGTTIILTSNYAHWDIELLMTPHHRMSFSTCLPSSKNKTTRLWPYHTFISSLILFHFRSSLSLILFRYLTK